MFSITKRGERGETNVNWGMRNDTNCRSKLEKQNPYPGTKTNNDYGPDI